MCGFAGLVRLDGGPIDEALLARMTRVIAHRGPDGEGLRTLAGGQVGLGFRRLAILDLSDVGMQPMSNEDGSVWVAFNGEIYNHAELRERLVARGHVFRSRTDTEVLVHLWEDEGPDLVHSLRGMFAFAIFDERARTLCLARDRLGIKPLFVAEHAGMLRFGSELKVLLQDPSLPRELDPHALDAYLAQNYVAAPRTLLRVVRQLEPGERVVYQLPAAGEAPRVEARRYWQLRFPDERERPQRSDGEWVELLESELRAVVKSHLVADVPVGALLSGGLDSSTLVGLVKREHGARTLTFTAEFAEATYGEGALARSYAEAIGAANEQVLFGPPSLELLRRIVWHSDEPTADLSMPPFFAVCELARRHVAVALSGEGADEVFAGYETYAASLVARRWQAAPSPLRAAVRALAESVPDSDAKIGLGQKLKRFVRGVEEPGESAHLAWRRICEPSLRRELLGREQVPSTFGLEAFQRSGTAHPLERMLFADLSYYLPSDMLVKADRMSMAHGLEARVPYLDHVLVELAAAMPPRLKLRSLTERKWVLRRVSERVLPPAVRVPKAKKGFNVPMAEWFRGPLREVLVDLLSPERVARIGLLSPQVVTSLVRSHLGRERDRSFELYGLLMLSLWADHALSSRAA